MSNVKLSSSDNMEFSVAKDVAVQSVLIKNMLEGGLDFELLPGSHEGFETRVWTRLAAMGGRRRPRLLLE